jgi:hypothetical protein
MIRTEEDEFWQIALGADEKRLDHHQEDDSGPAVEEVVDNEKRRMAQGNELVDDDPIAVTCPQSYCLSVAGSSLTLRLSGLSAGISSPLGAQAWYGAALLSSLLLTPTTSELAEALASLQDSPSSTALELGSGAVGLSGLTLACILAHRGNNRRGEHNGDSSSNDPGLDDEPVLSTARVVLTDNDPLVLQQLQVNVQSTKQHFSENYPELVLPEVKVLPLDWNDAGAISAVVATGAAKQAVRLVVGSELVYTADNARACADAISTILRDNPQVLVVIVQVTDREGWNNVFLPALYEEEGVRIRTDVADAHLHDLASKLIPIGGTTDRFDFGVCYISRPGSA